jgi:hypothetical protein
VCPAVAVEVVSGTAADLVQGALIVGDLAAVEVFTQPQQSIGGGLRAREGFGHESSLAAVEAPQYGGPDDRQRMHRAGRATVKWR